MKSILSLLLLGLFTLTMQAQDFAKIDKSVLDAAYYPANATKRTFAKTAAAKEAAQPMIRVLYSRPMAKGRKVFGELLKFNEPWRIGANESTEILFMTDAVFGDTPVKAGRYTLIAVPTADSWTIYLNTENDGWGNYSYNAESNIAEYKAATQSADSIIEALSITMFEKSKGLVHLKIGWDKTYVEVPISL